ncbi:MAG: DNA polymerase III subunit alpha [Hyphomicrobiaceae bacterium]
MIAPIRSSIAASPASVALPAKLPAFVHLKVHSAYSLLEGALPISKLVKLAESHGMPAVGLTDTNNMFGILEFSDKLAASGIQPIAGVSLAVDFEDGAPPAPGLRQPGPAPAGTSRGPAGKIALFAMSEAGYANLIKLVSRAHLAVGAAESPHVTFTALAAHAGDVVALTGGPEGPIDAALRDARPALAEARLRCLAGGFRGRLYVEIQRHGLETEKAVEPQLLSLAYAHDIPVVAANECFFATPEDYEAHDALLCIAEGRTLVEDNRRRLSRAHYFKTADEMAEVFCDLPEALANTIEIARRCAFRPRGRKPILPRFVPAHAGASEADLLAAEAAELKRQAEDGLRRRLEHHEPAPGFTADQYRQRLAFELDVIARMKFPGYFLIVADFIKWAKAQGIPVGPGRGSGAGSLAAWALTITDIDPLRFGLLFERFLNPERVSMPDFDIDFCQDRRDEVIRYVQEKYGAGRVAQIITHGKLQARAVLRDVGRVLQMPHGQVDKLCKLVPSNPANPVTLEEAIAGEPRLQEAREAEPIVARLLEIAQKLEGLYRHASIHAAGMVIGDRPLDELVPLTRDSKSNFPITQFNWKMVEAAGLVKFDFLGLKTLTVLQEAVQLIKRGRGLDLNLAKLALDDPKPYEILTRGETAGVFQLESTGMRDSLKRLRPNRFEDIIAMVALYRPGPMDNIPTYINRKHGHEEVDCLHPLLEGILKETYGVVIYQEQVIQIAQAMGGYSLGEADLLRRAMGKKDKVEMANHQARFVEGALRNGVRKDDAVYIFELVDKFAGYGFNKSHAAAYALISYQTAYLKAHFPEEFLAASMTLDLNNTDKLAMFAAQARKSGIVIKPPSVNASGVKFAAEPGTPDRPGAIRYALAALKNIGSASVQTIAAERTANGPFADLSDFVRRFDVRSLNKRALETLCASGAFDELEDNRALVHHNVDSMIALAQRLEADAKAGTGDLFAAGPRAAPQLDLRPAKRWTPIERLEKEFDAVGFYLSGHPLDAYRRALQSLGVKRFAEFEASAERGAASGRLAGIVIAARERRSQKGNPFAFATFSDSSGQFEAVIFSDTLSQCRELLEPGTPVLLTVEAERDEDSLKIRVQGMTRLDRAARGVQRGLKVVLDPQAIAARKSLDALKTHLRSSARGSGEIRFLLPLSDQDREMEFSLPGRYEVGPALRSLLSTVAGVVDVQEL